MIPELIITSRDELHALIIDAVDSSLEKRQEMTSSEPKRTVLDIDAFCEYTGLSKQTVYRKTRSGKVPHSKRGKRLYFELSEVDEWLLANKISTDVITDKVNDFFNKNRAKH